MCLAAPALARAGRTPHRTHDTAREPGAGDTGSVRHTKNQNLRAYVELLRSDVRAQKVAILTELMELNEAQDTGFWPIYRE